MPFACKAKRSRHARTSHRTALISCRSRRANPVPLAVLVNNAAQQILGMTGLHSVNDMRVSFEVNVAAPLALVSNLLEALAAARSTVINIGSAHALQSKPGLLPYAVSKAALAGLTRSLALDLAPRGIRVNEIRPGATARSLLLAGFERYPQALARVADAAFVVDGGIGVRVHDPL